MPLLTVGKLKEILAAFDVPDETLVEAYEGEVSGINLVGPIEILFINTNTGEVE